MIGPLYADDLHIGNFDRETNLVVLPC